MNEHITITERTDTFRELVGYMINRSLESGMMKRNDIVIMLEDMIQQVERGSLKTILEYT